MKLKELKNAIHTKKEKDLLIFIRKNFEQRGNMSRSEINNNLYVLKMLDDNTVNIAKARMEAINETKNFIKVFATFSGFLLAIITYYAKIINYENTLMLLPDALPFTLIILVFLFSTMAYRSSTEDRITANYFHALLKNIAWK